MLTWRIWTSCPQLPPTSFLRARLTRPISPLLISVVPMGILAQGAHVPASLHIYKYIYIYIYIYILMYLIHIQKCVCMHALCMHDSLMKLLKISIFTYQSTTMHNNWLANVCLHCVTITRVLTKFLNKPTSMMQWLMMWFSRQWRLVAAILAFSFPLPLPDVINSSTESQ